MKISYGLCCTRFCDIKNTYEILLVNKRYSYAFISFVIGSYSTKNKPAIRAAFNNMTASEKNIILSYNYDYIYYHAFLVHKKDLTDIKLLRKYILNEKKFYYTFTREMLMELMDGTHSIKSIWEFPKGRGEVGEDPLESAIREVREETGIIKYDILTKIPPAEYIVDKIYKYILYFAVCNEYVAPTYVATLNSEILEVEWMPLDRAKYLLSSELYDIAKKSIKVSKNNFNSKENMF